jgi:hypothetical protein
MSRKFGIPWAPRVTTLAAGFHREHVDHVGAGASTERNSVPNTFRQTFAEILTVHLDQFSPGTPITCRL